jgi:hypothetical protein
MSLYLHLRFLWRAARTLYLAARERQATRRFRHQVYART